MRYSWLCLIGIFLIANLAHAELSPETRALMDRISQLENQVQTMSQKGGPQTIGSSAYSGNGVGIADPAAGNLELRMADLERQLRDMTGQIEQANFAAKKAQADLEKVKSDYDLRLQTLEHKGAAASTTAAATLATNQANLTTAKDDSLVVSTNDEDQTSAAIAEKPKPVAKLGEDKPKPDQLYDDAYKAMQAKDYTKAQSLYQQFLTENPKHSLAGNAQYWLGESYYARADYKNAGTAFAEAYQKYPKSPKAPDSLLKLGLSLSAQNRPKDACVVYKQLVKAYPTASGTIATKAESELTRLKCK